MDGDGEDQTEGAVDGSSSEARSSPRPLEKSNNSSRNQDISRNWIVDLKKHREMHAKNAGKFREPRAQKLLSVSKGRSSRKSGTSNTHLQNAEPASYKNAASKEPAEAAGVNKGVAEAFPRS